MNPTTITMTSVRPIEREDLQKVWGWFAALGGCLMFLGTCAIAYAPFATLASMFLLGWLLTIGGAFSAAHAFMRRSWDGFSIDLLSGLLYLVVGFMIIANPGPTAVVFTLVIALFLVFGGVFRIVGALAAKPPHAMWVLLSGAVSLVLGCLIWTEWPISGLFAIGLFIGIEMLFNGLGVLMLGLAAKSLDDQPPREATE